MPTNAPCLLCTIINSNSWAPEDWSQTSALLVTFSPSTQSSVFARAVRCKLCFPKGCRMCLIMLINDLLMSQNTLFIFRVTSFLQTHSIQLWSSIDYNFNLSTTFSSSILYVYYTSFKTKGFIRIAITSSNLEYCFQNMHVS